MPEQSPPPVPDSNAKTWWFAWILATVIIPGGTFAIFANMSAGLEFILPLVGLVAFVLHIIASVKLGKGKSGWLTAGLIFGGWVLMLVSVFVGCLALVTISPK